MVGDYVLSLKSNQESLHEDVKLFYEDAISEGFDVPHGFWEDNDWLFKQESSKTVSVRRKINKAGWDNEFLARILAGIWCVSPAGSASLP